MAFFAILREILGIQIASEVLLSQFGNRIDAVSEVLQKTVIPEFPESARNLGARDMDIATINQLRCANRVFFLCDLENSVVPNSHPRGRFTH
ncbi:hypothetical protein [Haloparvum sedimenti]|uniref:hypothetical protein n=1 Tax=Haloparvum sedimenti TaxID=1678448 RepID=UPI00071E74C5